MYQKTNFLASASSILLIISLVLASSASFTKAENQRYDDCKPLEAPCGFKIKIAYPFWDSRQQQYCGHPSFKLECNKNESLTITIEGQTYNVHSINYEAKTFTLSKPQFLPKGECVKSQNQLTNSTLDYTLFDFSSKSQNATMFYDCVSTKLDPNPPYAFTCELDSYSGGPSTFQNSRGYIAINTTWDQKLHESCGFMIQVPILNSSAEALANGAADIANVLNKGFELQWMIEEGGECEDCRAAGGRCGFDQTLGKQICFCKQGGDGRSCGESLSTTQDSVPEVKDTKNSFARNAIALGIGIAVCMILSMILCFCFYRRHKNKSASMPFFTHNKSYHAHSSGSSTQFLTGSTYFGVHVFNYRELEEATEFFNPSKELGEGGFGTVYYGKLKDGREVAIKRLYENNNKRAEQFLNEVEILANLRHRNLVNLYGCTSRQSRELLLVYEYVPNGTVADHLHGKQSKVKLLPWSTRLSIATETASALVYLHDSDIIHRDVKTQNILLDTDFTVKVADFGLSRLFPLDVTHVSTAPQGTPGYVDPEYHQCYQLTEKSDVYSFGVLLAELISSLPAVDITRKRTDINLSNLAMNKIQNHALHEFVDSSLGFESDFKVKQEITSVSELCFQCLQCTKEMRPSMNEVLKRLLTIQGVERSEMDSAEVLDIPADDFLMLKGDFSPSSPPRDDTLADRYKLNASV